MLTQQEKREEINYQVKLIQKDKRKNKGHLTLEERDKITILFAEGLSIRKIAMFLNRNASTISRELNRPDAVYFRGKYIGSQSHLRIKNLWLKTHNKPKLNNIPIRKYVIKCLKLGLTPELIAGRLRVEFNFKIYHETIYKFIYDTNNKLHLTKYLLRRKYGRVSRNIRKHNKRTYIGKDKTIPNRVDIDLRPIEANLRLEFGHFEADSIEGKRERIKLFNGDIRQTRKSCLTVMVDRLTRKTFIRKTASKTSQLTTTSIIKALKPYQNTIKSITYDNGKEFSKHEKINNMLNIKSYFCKPYHSWEKGTVENINGLIRRFFPKGTNFDMISDEDVKRVEDWINNRPMKILNFKTPNEKYMELIQIH